MLKTNLLFIGILIAFFACNTNKTLSDKTITPPPSDPLQYVNPFIGTGGHGHTYPGASSPFGMMQLSPDTRLIGWDGCSGYHYSDKVIHGFSHTHLSGTGVSDYGDILLMPVNNAQQIKESGLDYDDFNSPFSHEKETASAGFYSVHLDKPNVDVALTTSPRCGIHEYVFNAPEQPAIVLDLEHRDEVLSCDFKIINNKRIEGHRHSKAWATDQRVFFVMEFSVPFTEHEIKTFDKTNTPSKGIFIFPENTKAITVKVAISPVDLEGAGKNFDQEIKPYTFKQVKAGNEDLWRKELTKIEATCANEDEMTIFYTALYHSMLAPNVYSDVDGRYRGMDLKVHQDKAHTHYTVFSLWDTYRATHPLYTIIQQKRTNDFVETMLKKYKQGGIIPIWDLSACYTGCMIGYHGVSVIADAHKKGIRGYDAELALEAMIHSAEQDQLGLEDYKKHGFISLQNEAESVSKTLEYAYDDWCIAQMAKDLGREKDYQHFLNRSLNYRNLFDPETKFFRPKAHNFWKAPFNPFEVNSNYTEANAWHYGFSAVHDMEGFTELHGGEEQLDQILDSLFSASSSTAGREQVDITGLIGQYAHGNEPSHHIAYLYNYINKPWKTQQRIREILDTQYSNTPDGISGNEDCGQMSAWYILSAMGFYSVLPGSDYYVIGSPSIRAATINLENGKQFEITTANNSDKNVYIQSVLLNGKPYQKSYIKHNDIVNGGKLHFVMGAIPNKNWGSQDENIPASTVEDSDFIAAPYIAKGALSFMDKNEIKLASPDPESEIFYAVNGGKFQAYKDGKSILFEESGNLCIYAMKNDNKSATLCTDFVKRKNTLSIQLNSQYADTYNGGTPDALIDGLRGGRDFRTGGWQGFEGKHLECIVDLSKLQAINQVSCGFLQDNNSWIFFPESVEFHASENGKDYTLIGTAKTTVSLKEEGTILEDFTVKSDNIKARYIKIKANSVIKCPPWHKGYEYDGKAWIFADEIIVE